MTDTPAPGVAREAGRAARKVMVSPQIMAEWTRMRTLDGYLLTMEWGEPDADGFYEPVITRHDDDRLVMPITEERLEAALRATGALWSANDYYEATTDAAAFASAILAAFPTQANDSPEKP